MQVSIRVAPLRSLTAAARALGMSQTMATKHMAALEKQLGVKLLHRTTSHPHAHLCVHSAPEVDIYEGQLQGIALAEVELAHIDQDVPLPEWVGEEVTGRPEFKKIEMLKARRASGP